MVKEKVQAFMATLYHVPLSPFCRKVRLSLAEKKIEVGLVEERYWEQDADFLRRNPAGKVPVLKIDNATMSESAAICEYLEEAYPTPALLPQSKLARLEVRVLFEELVARIKTIEPNGDEAFVRSNFVNGIKRMPVTVTLN